MAGREEDARAVAQALREQRGLACGACGHLSRAMQYPDDQDTCPVCGEGPVEHVYIDCWMPEPA
jgi:rubrerythrin